MQEAAKATVDLSQWSHQRYLHISNSKDLLCFTKKVLAVVVSITGVASISISASPSPGVSPASTAPRAQTGDILVLAAAAFYAAYEVLLLFFFSRYARTMAKCRIQ